MERLFTFWHTHMQVPTEARKYMHQHMKLTAYTKGEYYINSIEVRHNWCFVLEGLVAEVSINPSGKQNIDWIFVTNDYFTGTNHPFTRHNEGKKIIFLQNSTIIQVPNHIIQYAQIEYPSFSEFLQILKQKKLSRYALIVRILHQTDKKSQLLTYFELLPELANLLSVEQTCAFLNMTRRSYYRALKDQS